MLSKPDWLKMKMPDLHAMEALQRQFTGLQVNTVCFEACCPNSGECFSRGVATILILGNTCTRNCGFCAVKYGFPGAVDKTEPERVAKALSALPLRHLVITSVTRDDLPDGGAAHYAAVVKRLRRDLPGVSLELLIPDFQGERRSLQIALRERPEVLAHNLETVPRLYNIRPGADYLRSLKLLESAKQIVPFTLTKSGLMVGLGEKEKEVLLVMKNLREAGCDMLTIGQYLCPGSRQIPVERYITPEQFSCYQGQAELMGFKFAAAGSYVRSSYKAGEAFELARLKP